MLKFTPEICQITKDFISDKDRILDLSDGFGSPLNILFPQEMDNNINNFKDVLSKHRVQSKIFYAHKCNRSDTFVKQAYFNGINIDVASENELKSALANGFTGSRIEATGPKNTDFILLGLMQNIIFNVDNISELESIINLSKKIGKKEKTKVLVRLNGFSSESTKIINKQSRFGIPYKDFDKVKQILIENKKFINFLGLAFHLDTVNIKEKIIAIENCITLFEDCFESGLEPYVLDIGGGFKVNYIEDKKEWNDSISELKESILTGENPVTWNNASFGLRQEKGVLKGALNIYNYYDDMVGAKFLDELLSSPLVKFQNRSIGELLSENMIEVYLEPGKALLNQCGINLAKVTYSKRAENGDILIGMDMKKSDLLIGEQEMFLDPVIVNRAEREKAENGVYFIGNLCMENDFIFKHKVFTDFIPDTDDVLIFVNTAGYFMDFEQSHTIKQKTARKLVAVKSDRFRIYLDKEYNPYKI